MQLLHRPRPSQTPPAPQEAPASTAATVTHVRTPALHAVTPRWQGFSVSHGWSGMQVGTHTPPVHWLPEGHSTPAHEMSVQAAFRHTLPAGHVTPLHVVSLHEPSKQAPSPGQMTPTQRLSAHAFWKQTSLGSQGWLPQVHC